MLASRSTAPLQASPSASLRLRGDIPWLKRAIAAAALAFVSSAAAAEPPRVVASIVPIHSLVAGVMDGIGAPELIVKGAASPHSYALKPSEARALNEAQAVFWVGEALETFLEKPLSALAKKKARIVTLIAAPGVTTLPARQGGAWEGEDDGHGHGKKAHGHGAATDAHIWLDADNAKAIVKAAVAALSEVDAGNRAAYAANGDRLLARLDALDAELKTTLAPVKGKPFVVFHDGYQYFERRYGMNAVGSVTVNPERQPGARRLTQIRRKMRELEAQCIFREPNFDPALVKTVIEGTPVRTGGLNPEGAGLTPGPEAYFQLMRDMAASLKGCLAG